MHACMAARGSAWLRVAARGLLDSVWIETLSTIMIHIVLRENVP